MTYATVKGVGAVTERGGRDNGGVGKGFGNPLGVTSSGEAKDGEGDELKFSGEAVEVFFFVLIDMCEESMTR